MERALTLRKRLGGGMDVDDSGMDGVCEALRRLRSGKHVDNRLSGPTYSRDIDGTSGIRSGALVRFARAYSTHRFEMRAG